MKRCLLWILLVIFLTSCAPLVEVDVAKPVEDTVIEEPAQIQQETVNEGEQITEEEQQETIEEPQQISLANTIEIKQDAFYPKEKTIQKDTEIKWIKQDTRDYKLACYFEGNRVTQSSNLKEGDSFKYTFSKEGKYTCITSPYGLRNIIRVEAQAALLAPTGSVVGGRSIEGASLTLVALILTMTLLFFVLGKRKTKVIEKV